MKENYDGPNRRRNDLHLEAIEKKVDRVFDFLKIQFGDVDLVGNKVEGKISESLRELNTKVLIQNGRIKKLEDKSIFYKGSMWVLGILCTFSLSLAAVLVVWFKK